VTGDRRRHTSRRNPTRSNTGPKPSRPLKHKALAAAVALGLAGALTAWLAAGVGTSTRTGRSAALSDTQVGTGAISGGTTRLGGAAQAQAPSVVASGASALGPGHGAYDSVACISATSCVAVGAGPNGAGVAGVTTDGAKSWQAGSLPTGTPLLNSVACADAQHCVAVGQGAIVTSKDGGTTWAYQVPPSAQTTLFGVACNTGGDCIATGISPNPGAPYKAQLARSTDEGATWTSIALPSGMYGLGSVSCPTTQFCVAVGAALIVSNDGGQTWAPRTVNGGMGALSSVSCIDASRCIAVGANPQQMYTPSAPAYGISTADGGQTWTRITLPRGSATVQAISCSTEGSCLAGGPSPTSTGLGILDQLNADGSWSQSNPPPGMTDIAGLDCHISGECVAVGLQRRQPLSEVSTDSGASWTSTAVPFS